ncbi:hypothetical protein [Mycobacteroides abscessus]|uniref:hypothetical protein n=1 Tax=Mycobacteroides abscessus TaxID=36809 RepID=UPI0013FD0E66|nr:hypothetical protein [Mycobacteroides abscessus]
MEFLSPQGSRLGLLQCELRSPVAALKPVRCCVHLGLVALVDRVRCHREWWDAMT